MLYEFECPNGHKFEKLKNVLVDNEICPECGEEGKRLISTCNWSFGWRLTEASHERFSEDEWEKDV